MHKTAKEIKELWLGDNIEQAMEEYASQRERFKKPDEKVLIDFALLFNNGKIEMEKLSDMVAMCNIIIDRLYENGDISKPSSVENIDTCCDKCGQPLINDECYKCLNDLILNDSNFDIK